MKTFQTRINLISRCWSFYQELDTAAALEMQEDGGAFTIGHIEVKKYFKKSKFLTFHLE